MEPTKPLEMIMSIKLLISFLELHCQLCLTGNNSFKISGEKHL